MTNQLKLHFDESADIIEVGIDEAGRGCLAGRVYVAGVIFKKDQELTETFKCIKDSKKLTKKKREELRKYIEDIALEYSVAYAEPEEIDKENILQATVKTMHKVLDKLQIKPDTILVDGNYFHTYQKKGEIIPHQLVKNGDNTYYSIAAASILAKVYHDEYVESICKEDNDLCKYGWLTNMCYGTEEHRNAIVEHGISKYHRKTFGICKKY